MLEALGLTTLVPIVALIMGTGAIGSELEDGTAVHLLTKPVARWRIGIVKLVVGAACAAAISLPPVFVGALIACGDVGVALAYTIASLIATCVYVALFMALSLVTSRAFVIGLGYVLIWEGLLAGLFAGIGPSGSARSRSPSAAPSPTRCRPRWGRSSSRRRWGRRRSHPIIAALASRSRCDGSWCSRSPGVG